MLNLFRTVFGVYGVCQTYKFLAIIVFCLNACTMTPTIETKRDYDEDQAMQYYLTEKKTIEPELNSLLKQCSVPSGSIQLHWHLNRDGKATEIKLSEDALNCPAVSTLLKNHLKGLSFPKPQVLDRVELEYSFKIGQH
jgi:hypothetical protein